jgi:hypothetical protein
MGLSAQNLSELTEVRFDFKSEHKQRGIASKQSNSLMFCLPYLIRYSLIINKNLFQTKLNKGQISHCRKLESIVLSKSLNIHHITKCVQ